jgi:hypothetical protein
VQLRIRSAKLNPPQLNRALVKSFVSGVDHETGPFRKNVALFFNHRNLRRYEYRRRFRNKGIQRHIVGIRAYKSGSQLQTLRRFLSIRHGRLDEGE